MGKKNSFCCGKTLSARMSLFSHSWHLLSSSSLLARQSLYLAWSVAMPSSTAASFSRASSKMRCVVARSSWASWRACCTGKRRGEWDYCLLRRLMGKNCYKINGPSVFNGPSEPVKSMQLDLQAVKFTLVNRQHGAIFYCQHLQEWVKGCIKAHSSI